MAVCGVGKIKSTLECSEGDVHFLHELSASTVKHLQKYSLSNDFLSEGQLIAARVGLFSEVEWKYLTVCAHHRNAMGINWLQRQKTTCHYPDHKGKGKAERAVSLQVSKEIHQYYGVLLPIGTGK